MEGKQLSKKIKKRLFSVITTLSMAFTFVLMNCMNVYAWTVTNVSISNIVYDGESIQSMKVAYSYPSDSNSWPSCRCYVGIQEEPGKGTSVLKTDYASMHKPSKEATMADTSTNSLMKTLKIVAFNEGDGILSFGGYRNVSATVNMPADTELLPGKTYYMYIWTHRVGGSCDAYDCHQPNTSGSSDFYIDAYLGQLSIGIDGYITFKYPNGTAQGFGTHKTHSFEYSVVDNQLIAKCKGSAGGCTFSTCNYNTDEKAVKLSLTANESVTYNGNNVTASFGSGEAAAWKTAVGSDAPAIKYEYKATADGTYATTTQTKNAGYYRASVTAGGKTIYKEFQITKATPAAPTTGEGYTISYANETISAKSGYEISTSDTSVSAPEGGKLTPGATYYVRKKADSNNEASAWTAITFPERPATPTGLTASAVTYIDAKDGTISGVNSTMEYSTDGGSTWTKATGTTITGLEAGDVRVRVAATTSAPASDYTTVAVPDHIRAAKDRAKAAIDAEVNGDTNEEVLAAADEAKAAIESKDNLDDISDAELDGIAKIAELKHLIVLDEVKKAAKAEIDYELGEDTSENVKKAAEDAKKAIDAATSIADVEKATDNGIDAIEAEKQLNETKSNEVIEKINAIGTVTLTDTCKAKIDDARKAYDALTADQKAMITDAQLAVLKAAETHYKELLNAGKYEGVDTSSGIVKDITGTHEAPEETNHFEATIVNSSELETLIGVTAAEKAEGVNVWLELTDATETMPEADKSKIKAEAGKDIVAMYLDASLFMKVGDNDAEAIHELNDKIKVSFVVPEDLRKEGRVFKIIRLHDGVATTIDGSYDAATGIFTFETDRFSSYALTYVSAESTSPNTGDNTSVAMYLLMMLGSMTLAFYAFKKRRA